MLNFCNIFPLLLQCTMYINVRIYTIILQKHIFICKLYVALHINKCNLQFKVQKKMFCTQKWHRMGNNVSKNVKKIVEGWIVPIKKSEICYNNKNNDDVSYSLGSHLRI